MSEFSVISPPSYYDHSPDELAAFNDVDVLPDAGKYARYYSDESFWRKLGQFGRRALGRHARHHGRY